MLKYLLFFLLFTTNIIFSQTNIYEVSGNVGISTSTPSAKLHIYKGNSFGVPHQFADLVVEDDVEAMISLLTPNTRTAYYGFADQDDSYVGGMSYDHLNNEMYFRVNNHLHNIVINSNGNVGIGTNTPDAKLTVKGNIHAQEVKVDLAGAVTPDYVFLKDYPLRTLDEVDTYIKSNGHLPNIPSAAVMEKEGLKLKEMNLKLLEKIEELTLYTIEQEKAIQELIKDKELNTTQNKRIQELEQKLQKLISNSKKV